MNGGAQRSHAERRSGRNRAVFRNGNQIPGYNLVSRVGGCACGQRGQNRLEALAFAQLIGRLSKCDGFGSIDNVDGQKTVLLVVGICAYTGCTLGKRSNDAIFVNRQNACILYSPGGSTRLAGRERIVRLRGLANGEIYRVSSNRYRGGRSDRLNCYRCAYAVFGRYRNNGRALCLTVNVVSADGNISGFAGLIGKRRFHNIAELVVDNRIQRHRLFIADGGAGIFKYDGVRSGYYMNHALGHYIDIVHIVMDSRGELEGSDGNAGNNTFFVNRSILASFKSIGNSCRRAFGLNRQLSLGCAANGNIVFGFIKGKGLGRIRYLDGKKRILSIIGLNAQTSRSFGQTGYVSSYINLCNVTVLNQPLHTSGLSGREGVTERYSFTDRNRRGGRSNGNLAGRSNGCDLHSVLCAVFSRYCDRRAALRRAVDAFSLYGNIFGSRRRIFEGSLDDISASVIRNGLKINRLFITNGRAGISKDDGHGRRHNRDNTLGRIGFALDSVFNARSKGDRSAL